ncbi:MAG: MOSC domain-containing protein [Lachnospiraceae bacterium]|nr:MOSC domain-containing protein [Lachnospiraceae bacterium]
MRGEIKAICISEKRGTAKHEIPEAKLIENFGIENDAHAGNWHRQVSLLSYDEVEAFKKRGAQVENGAFGENILMEGYDLKTLSIGTRFICKDVVLELTQIGKQCHSHCEIYKQVGDCIMPREGVFTKVIHGGILKKGDVFEVIQNEEK